MSIERIEERSPADGNIQQTTTTTTPHSPARHINAIMVRSVGHGTEEGHAWVLTMAQAQVQYVAQERPRQEMREKARGRDVFFSASRLKDRPFSVYTEFMESDTEIEHGDDQDDDSEVYSEFGDLEGIEDGECSPRISVGSVRYIIYKFQPAVAAGAKGG